MVLGGGSSGLTSKVDVDETDATLLAPQTQRREGRLHQHLRMTTHERAELLTREGIA
jgi:hypothetical protein